MESLYYQRLVICDSFDVFKDYVEDAISRIVPGRCSSLTYESGSILVVIAGPHGVKHIEYRYIHEPRQLMGRTDKDTIAVNLLEEGGDKHRAIMQQLAIHNIPVVEMYRDGTGWSAGEPDNSGEVGHLNLGTFASAADIRKAVKTLKANNAAGSVVDDLTRIQKEMSKYYSAQVDATALGVMKGFWKDDAKDPAAKVQMKNRSTTDLERAEERERKNKGKGKLAKFLSWDRNYHIDCPMV